MKKIKENPVSFIRIILGLFFAAHGVSKALNFAGTTAFFSSLGFPVWVTVIITALEIIVGISLILNFKTKLAAIILILILLVAIFKVKLSKGFLGGYEMDLLYIAIAITVLMDNCNNRKKIMENN